MTPARPVRVTLPAALRALFPGCPAEHLVVGRTVAELIETLDRTWPGMGARLCDGRPALRRHIAVYVGEQRATLETPLPPGADVLVMTAISGG